MVLVTSATLEDMGLSQTQVDTILGDTSLNALWSQLETRGWTTGY